MRFAQTQEKGAAEFILKPPQERTKAKAHEKESPG
jgi:hypothetical protein